MRIVKLVFRERPAYQDMYIRPFGIDATPDMVNQLCLETNEGTDISPAALARSAGRIIRPVSDVRGRAIIANGWNEKRYMFLMTVEVRDRGNMYTTLDISGYTDSAEVSETIRGVKFPDDMALYFNSVTELEQFYVNAPGSGASGYRSTVKNSSHIIIPQAMPDFTRDRATPGTVTLRPVDIFQRPGKDIISTTFDRMAKKDNFLDARFSFANRQVRMSNRLNDSAARYLSRSLTALGTAVNEQGTGGIGVNDVDTTAALQEARRLIPEKNFNSWQPLAELTRDSNILEQGFITYGELKAMNEDFPFEDVEVYFLPKRDSFDFRSTSDWNGRGNTAVAATTLARGLPSYMAFHQIAVLEFEANNLGLGGEPMIMITHAVPFLGQVVDERSLLSLENRLNAELFSEMLPWDDCTYDVRVEANLSMDVNIKYIQIDNETPEHFVFPVFCDSLVPPILANTNEDVVGMSTAITDIVDNFGTDRSEYRSTIIKPGAGTGYNF